MMPLDPTRLLAVIETQNAIAATALDVVAIMDRVVDRARALTSASAGVVEIAEGDEMVYRAVSGTALPHLGTRLPIATSLSGACFSTGTVLSCDDARTDERVDRAAAERVGALSMVCVPLRYGDVTVGVLKVYDAEPGRFGSADAELLGLLSGVIGSHMTHASTYEARARESREDALTGAGNRRAYDERIAEEVGRAGRHGRPLSLVIFDLDGFKTLNDRDGHEAGDRVLREFAALIADGRAGDTAYRLGGDEFAIVLPETDAPGAEVVAQRIAERLSATRGDVGVSWGVSELDDEPASLFAAADAALYAAKALGTR